MYTPRNFNMPIKKSKLYILTIIYIITHPWLTRFTQFKCICHCSNGPYLKRKKIFDVELLVNMQLLCKEKKFLYTKLRICTNVNLRIYIAAKKMGRAPPPRPPCMFIQCKWLI